MTLLPPPLSREPRLVRQWGTAVQAGQLVAASRDLSCPRCREAFGLRVLGPPGARSNTINLLTASDPPIPQIPRLRLNGQRASETSLIGEKSHIWCLRLLLR
ncbi:hypothetical protein BDV12DRAFT_179113 [Aspergillus spectabilis]